MAEIIQLLNFEIMLCTDWQGNALPEHVPGTNSIEYKYFVRISEETDLLVIAVDAPYHHDLPPISTTAAATTTSVWIEEDQSKMAERMRFPGLHNYEVVEVFIASTSNSKDLPSNPYLEIQLGPHGHYMLISFPRESDWTGQSSYHLLDLAPRTEINTEIGRWTTEVSIPFHLLPNSLYSTIDRYAPINDSFGDRKNVWNSCATSINVCAIHGPENERRYLSYANLGKKDEPAFHQLQCFIPIATLLNQ